MLNLPASRWREDRGGGDEGRIGRRAVTLITESVTVVTGLEGDVRRDDSHTFTGAPFKKALEEK